MKRRLFCVLVSSLIFAGLACSSEEEEEVGLSTTEPAGGPQVQFELDTYPFPNIPFPNDRLTRPDDASPTGVRVDLPGASDDYGEARFRSAFNEAAGFGVFSPISISFDRPLDIDELIKRHQQLTPDFSDDAIYLVNVDPDSPNYGELSLLDMGLGNFPITLARPDNYYENDRRSDGTNMLFPTASHHGGEPNLRDPDGDPYDFREVLDFYERETHTLLLRPVHPLEPGTRYAVVLTSAVRGEDVRPIDSPFDWINDPAQTETIEPIREILPQAYPERFRSTLDNVRFAWSFTTDVPTEMIEQVRAGLYGHGPLAELDEMFPANFHRIHNVTDADDESQMIFDLDALLPALLPLIADAAGSATVDVMQESFDFVDYIVSGSYMSPSLLGELDGMALDAEPDLVLDSPRGAVEVTRTEVPFFCVAPEATADNEPPFPVIIYSHAIGSTRLEILGFAGSMAKFGFATCTVDAAGHGVEIPDEFATILDNVAAQQGLTNLPTVLGYHRARDLTNDGAVDSSGDYVTSNMVHTRNMFRQTTIDQIQLVRILRSFDGEKSFVDGAGDSQDTPSAVEDIAADWDLNGDGEPALAGDFTGEGQVSFGGDRPYVTWGTSLGGIQSTVLAAAEPTIVAGASNAGGGGLADIAARSTISNVRSSTMLRMFGPLLVGNPSADGESTTLEWLLPEVRRPRRVALATISGLQDGDRVVLRNLAREEHDDLPPEAASEEVIVEDGAFRVGVAAESMLPIHRRLELGFDSSIDLYEEIMGCEVTGECGGVECPDWHYCSDSSECRPIGGCADDFDPGSVSEEFAQEYERRVISDPTEFGDPLVIEIYDANGDKKKRIDTFRDSAVDQNIHYPPGAPLAALSDGWGLTRQTPKMRQFIGLSQMIIEPVDPAVWAPHLSIRPLEFPYESEPFQRGDTNFLTIATVGDQTVPISSSIAIARAAGAIETLEPDYYYEMPKNQYLIENYVYEGISWLDRFPSYPNTLFDPDVLDGDRWDGPKPNAAPPVRATRYTDTGVNALRFGYLDPTGEHTFNVPDPSLPFDAAAFLTNQVGWFLSSGGVVLTDELCLEDFFMSGCGFFSPETFSNPL